MPVPEPDVRYCKACKDFLPLDRFQRPGQKRYVCDTHMRERARFYASGTKERRAVTSYWARTYKDLPAYGLIRIAMSQKELLSMLSEDQVENHSNWSIVPRDPAQELTQANALIVDKDQRKLLVAVCRRDRGLYKQIVEGLAIEQQL